MKALQILSNVDRAKLLVDLFPSHLKDLVDYIESKCKFLQDNSGTSRENWNDGIITHEFYKFYVDEIATLINRLGPTLRKNRTVFADQLFYHYRAIVTSHLILEYAVATSKDMPFNMAVALLFCEDSTEYIFSFNLQPSSN